MINRRVELVLRRFGMCLGDFFFAQLDLFDENSWFSGLFSACCRDADLIGVIVYDWLCISANQLLTFFCIFSIDLAKKLSVKFLQKLELTQKKSG